VKKGHFSKIVVVICLLEMVAIQVWSMRIASRNALLVTGLLTANHAVFGGELLMLCLKRIFSKEKTEGEEFISKDL
jgi:hypothetical protein